MSLPKDKAWFTTKRYGYGWGLPSRWQGWLVILLFFSFQTAGIPFANSHPIGFIIYSIVLCAAFGVVCYWKGERPRWRWRKKDVEKLPDEQN